MLTIIIFTNNRYSYVSSLLKDLLEAQLNIKYWIVVWSAQNPEGIKQFSKRFEKNKSIKNNIKLQLGKNKQIKFFTQEKYMTFEERFLKYIKSAKTKYVWFIGDDDRIETNYLQKLLLFLKKNQNSGFVLGHHSFKKNQEITKGSNIKKKIITKSLDIEKDVTKIGMMSSLIFNTHKFKKILNSLNMKLLKNNGYPQTYIVMKLNQRFKDWKIISNKVIFYRYGNLNYKKKDYLLRLNFELNGYLQPAEEIYGINTKTYQIIFKKVFYSYIIDWIAETSKKVQKKDIVKLIKKNIHLFPQFWDVNIMLFIIIKLPTIVSFYILKIINKLFLKLTFLNK